MVEKRKTKAGTGGCKHKSTEEPNGHDHRPRWFVRGDECWSVVIVDGVVERGSGDGKKAKSCVGKEKTVCHFGPPSHPGFAVSRGHALRRLLFWGTWRGNVGGNGLKVRKGIGR